MKRKRFREEQIIGILKEAESSGNIRGVCREHNMTEQSFYRWRRKYGREVSEANKLRDLEPCACLLSSSELRVVETCNVVASARRSRILAQMVSPG